MSVTTEISREYALLTVLLVCLVATPVKYTGFQRLRSDVRDLHKHVLKIGAIVALLCHVAPPHYKAVCHMIATLCGAGER